MNTAVSKLIEQQIQTEQIKNELLKEMKEINEYVGASHVGPRKHPILGEKPLVTVCIDFDGTMVQHEYPEIGPEAEGCIETLTRWVEDYNVGIILDTMRSDEYLVDAVQWCNDNGIKLYGIGCDPTQKYWTNSTKAYAPFSIDDRNIGCPLIYGKSKRPYVDWKGVAELFEPILKALNGID